MLTRTILPLAASAAILCQDPLSLADDHAYEPVEYVLGPDSSFQTLSDTKPPLEQRVRQQGRGERGDRWISHISHPTLTVYRPSSPPHAAVVVCPGGGYSFLSFDKEGTYVARWLVERGFAAGVLKYSTAGSPSVGDDPLLNGPLSEAQQAIKLLKHQLNVPVGVIGFSAGGHLAACAANRFSDPASSSTGALAAYDSRIAFHALIYPVISMENGATHGGSRKNLLGASATEPSVRAWSMDQAVTGSTSPAFLVATGDDRVVPVENSLRYYRACQAAGVPAEIHIYPEGGHGYGMWCEKATVADWPLALEKWLNKVARPKND